MLREAVLSWPRRRWVAVLALVPVMAAWFYAAGSTGGVRPDSLWGLALLPAAVLGAAVLASYVPATGRSLDLGCSPCAVMAAVTVVGATVALANYGPSLTGPLVAAGFLLFGLTQRLGQQSTCATPPR